VILFNLRSKYHQKARLRYVGLRFTPFFAL